MNAMEYNPAQVMMGYSSRYPYLRIGTEDRGTGAADTNPAPAPVPQSSTLAPESVRATGTGPFDAAYRQNLATYAGGLLSRPGGNLSFDPTGPASDFPSGPSLLEQALGGGAWQPQTPTPAQQSAAPLSWQDWLTQFRNQGSLLTGGAFRARELQ